MANTHNTTISFTPINAPDRNTEQSAAGRGGRKRTSIQAKPYTVEARRHKELMSPNGGPNQKQKRITLSLGKSKHEGQPEGEASKPSEPEEQPAKRKPGRPRKAKPSKDVTLNIAPEKLRAFQVVVEQETTPETPPSTTRTGSVRLTARAYSTAGSAPTTSTTPDGQANKDQQRIQPAEAAAAQVYTREDIAAAMTLVQMSRGVRMGDNAAEPMELD